MNYRIFDISDEQELSNAGPEDLIRLLPLESHNPLFLTRKFLEILTYSISNAELIHLSGPTGSAKSSIIEALMSPANFLSLCRLNGCEDSRPLAVYPIEMVTFESPAEIYQRRSLKDGSTYDEKSTLIQALEDASKNKKKYRPLIWLREIGRVHSAAIQGGLLNLMQSPSITLPDGHTLDTSGIAWIADSNYQASENATHTLVTFDDSLKRRFSINLTLDYLPAVQEEQIIRQFAEELNIDPEINKIIPGIIKLGNNIRQQKLDGSLKSIGPPTIYGYLSLLRLLKKLPEIDLYDAICATMLGHAGPEDSETGTTLFYEVFGIRSKADSKIAMETGGNWF